MNGKNRLTKFVKAQGISPLCLCTVAIVALMAAVPALAQSNDVINRVKRLETDVDTLNRTVFKGEKPPVAAGSAGGDATANLEVRVGQLENDLRTLTGKVEQQAYDNQQLTQKLQALEEDARMRLDALEAQARGAAPGGASPGGAAPVSGANGSPSAPVQPSAGASAIPAGEVDTNTVDPGGLTAADQTLPAPLQPEAGGAAADNVTGNETGLGAAGDAASLYEQGFAEIKREDYAAAEKSFAAFMKSYPGHALAPNALYWLGETYYARKDYNKASRTFAEAYQKYPNGPKGADNLLKLGLSLAGKGEKDNACIALGQLRKEYPKGPEAVLTRGEQEIKTLGCK